MNRIAKIVLFVVLSAAGIAAESLCCGNPVCIPGQNCKIGK